MIKLKYKLENNYNKNLRSIKVVNQMSLQA